MCRRLAEMSAEFFVVLPLKIIFLKMVEGKTNCVSTALLGDHLRPPHTQTHTRLQTQEVSVGKVPFLSGRGK